MCGIAGKFHYGNKDRTVSHELISEMCDLMQHRGPDDEGYYVSGPLGIGMRRLSIIDVEGGQQPISNEDGSVWVIQNGEIYNFQQLKKELEDRGHQFKTHCDTEVIVHAYEEFGTEFVKHLRGMFAIAIWDSKRWKLILARDRFGKKPLFYSEKNGTFWFASEMKSLLADPDVERRVNLESLDLYFSYQYIPCPLSIFKDIYKLPPATVMVIQKKGVSSSVYWHLDNRPDHNLDEEEYTDGIRQKLTEAVRLRLISDVPLGAFLSGGIDSSIVVSLMAELSNRPVKTFSIGFEEDDFNELEYARTVSRLYNTDHEEHIVSQDLVQTVPKLVWHYDEPFGDSSAIPTFHLSKVTRQGVTVALCGDAGDELFCGYTKYPVIERKARRTRLIQYVAKYGKRLLETVPIGALSPEGILRRVYSSVLSRTCGPVDRDFMWMTYYDDFFKTRLYSRVMAGSVSLDSARKYYHGELASSPDRDVINTIMYADLRNYMLNDLLVKVDIASMANSLEVRSPFLDHEFAEFAAAIPPSLKIRSGETKYLLKKAFSPNLPDKIIKRRKMGFAIPIDRWFRGKLLAYAKDVFAGEGHSCMEAYFNREFVRHLMDTHVNGKAQYGSKLWLLLMFVLWHITYVDGKSI